MTTCGYHSRNIVTVARQGALGTPLDADNFRHREFPKALY
jgi:hypothetical protein